MKIILNNDDIELLRSENINYSIDKDYTENEADEFLDLLYAYEAGYANNGIMQSPEGKLAIKFADLADKVADIIGAYE